MARRHAFRLFVVNESPNRLPIAMKAAVAIALPMSLAIVIGRPELGLLSAPGAFTVLYGPGAPGRFRLKLMSVAGAGLILSAVLGAAAGADPAASLTAMVVIAVVASVLCAALKVGPPGPYFFALVVGIASSVRAAGIPAGAIVAAVSVGVVCSVVVGMSDLVGDPRGPERMAIAAAEAAMTGYEAAVLSGSGIGEARDLASGSLHSAWTALNDGSRRRRLSAARAPLAARLVAVHQRYVTTTGQLAGVSVELAPADDPGRVVPQTIDLEQLRNTSLGRPHAVYLLRGALRWPSESLWVALRVAVSGLAAGLIAHGTGVGHAYWATAFSVLVVANIGTRQAQLFRGAQRFVGTVIGLVIFLGISLLEPQGWWLVVTLAALQFAVELLITRNYAYAVALITPLALAMATGGAAHAAPSTYVRDRLLDTVIGVAVAAVVVMLVGRRAGVGLVLESNRRALEAMRRVAADLAAGAWESVAARENRRHLYFELLEGAAVAGRARADDARVPAHLPLWSEIFELGYFLLGACWHPALRGRTDLFGKAAAALETVVAGAPSATSTAEIATVLAAVRRQLAAQRPDYDAGTEVPGTW